MASRAHRIGSPGTDRETARSVRIRSAQAQRLPSPQPARSCRQDYERRATAPRIAPTREAPVPVARGRLHPAEEQVELPEAPDRAPRPLERTGVDAGLGVDDAVFEVDSRP